MFVHIVRYPQFYESDAVNMIGKCGRKKQITRLERERERAIQPDDGLNEPKKREHVKNTKRTHTHTLQLRIKLFVYPSGGERERELLKIERNEKQTQTLYLFFSYLPFSPPLSLSHCYLILLISRWLGLLFFCPANRK